MRGGDTVLEITLHGREAGASGDDDERGCGGHGEEFFGGRGGEEVVAEGCGRHGGGEEGVAEAAGGEGFGEDGELVAGFVDGGFG